MKHMIPARLSMPLFALAACLGAATPVLAQGKAAAKTEVKWSQIGEASGIVGMAAVGKELFAITGANKLQVCDTAVSPVVWKEIGDGPGGNVVAMGVSDGKLFASTDARSAGRLALRDAVTTASAWQDQGHAWCLVGMAGAPGKMFGIVDTKEVGSEASLLFRDNAGKATENAGRGLDGIPWNGVDRRPPVGALAITAEGGKYYIVTKEDSLYIGDPTKPDVAWKAIGDAPGITILAGANGKLFATTKTGKLLMWAIK